MSHSLADELLNDFEDDDEVEGEEEAEAKAEAQGTGNAEDNRRGFEQNSSARVDGLIRRTDLEDLEMDEEDEVDEDDVMKNGETPDASGTNRIEGKEEAQARIDKMDLGGVKDVRAVAGLMATVEPVLEQIAHYQAQGASSTAETFVGSIEENPEYRLLTQANTLSTSIDNEIILVHKFIRDHYSARFPELERLVQNPLDYAKTVGIIGNGPLDKDSMRSICNSSDNIVKAPLSRILDGPSLMVVTVEASTSRGQVLSPTSLARIQSACEMTFSLDRAKKILTDYVQSRMTLFAPNLTALIGSLTAAQLLNFAGGITGLAKTPACNIPPLGSKQRNSGASGLATNVTNQQQGYLFHSPLIRSIPSHMKKQAMRIVSAKLVLAARVDRVHDSPDGAIGLSLYEATLARLDKLTEPPPNRGARALPAPDDKLARKRGGRRARKAKAATAVTDLRREQNRMAFGKEEIQVDFGDSTKGMGMIGQSNDGRIRNLKVDARTRAKLSAKTAASLKTRTSGIATTFGANTASMGMLPPSSGLRTMGVGPSGTSSTIAFTPVQGLELADPKRLAAAKRKADEANDRWFKGGAFTHIQSKAT